MVHHNITREDLQAMDDAAKENMGMNNIFPKCMRDGDFKAYYQGTPQTAWGPIEHNLRCGHICDAGKDQKLEKEEIPVLVTQLRWNKAKLIERIPGLWDLMDRIFW